MKKKLVSILKSKKLHILKEKNESFSEKIRLFYVALTRAREKMYFILPEYDSLKHVKNEFEFKSLSCFITHYFENTVAKYCSKVNYEDLVNKDYLEYTEEALKVLKQMLEEPVVELDSVAYIKFDIHLENQE